MNKGRNHLIEMYNATSTDDGTGDIETYEAWLERQLLSRINDVPPSPVREWTIDVKGFIPVVVVESMLDKKYIDISHPRGEYWTIKFTGTEADQQSFVANLQKDETYFKVIGIK